MNAPNPLSRREFLKLGSLATASMFLPVHSKGKASLQGQMGRVIYPNIIIFDTPSLDGKEVNTYWKDTVFPIIGVTVGQDVGMFNRVWYRIEGGGYAHSGGVQPVHIQLNTPIANILQGGSLAEVTVPFTDAHWSPGKSYEVAYRLYYETTHWVSKLVHDKLGNPWYKILEDKWELIYYAPAEHLQLSPAAEITPLSPDVPLSKKRLEVQTPAQMMVAYEYDRPVFMARAATGAQFSNGNFATPPGRHNIFHKRPSRHMAAGNLAANGFDLPGVPWVSYFTESGVAFHGTYWHNDYGHPRSHGCVNLTPVAAKWVYRWTMPNVPNHEQRVYEDYGTIVDVV